jgi:hypothetical protein
LAFESPPRLLDTRDGTGSTTGPASPSKTISLRVAVVGVSPTTLLLAS